MPCILVIFCPIDRGIILDINEPNVFTNKSLRFLGGIENIFKNS
jgi:hypothetical protein